MTWHEAAAFCEQHGGYLAVLPSKKDLYSLGAEIKNDQSIWLGAGSAGYGIWQWVDGSTWEHDIRKTSKTLYVLMDETGILSAKQASEKHPFFIEWMLDGSSPGSLVSQLKRSSQSLTSDDPIFPAGSTSFDGRNYFLVRKTANWTTALELAELAGGNLVTPSRADESEWLQTHLTNSLKENEACWAGGTREANQTWVWETKEPWQFVKWAEGAPNDPAVANSACAVLPSGMWDDFHPDTELPFFMIEWSEDHLQKAVKLTNTEAADMRVKCASLIKGIQKRYEDIYSNNIKGYEQQLSSYRRSIPKKLGESQTPLLTQMQSGYEANLIPTNLPREAMPPKVAKILDFHLRKQAKTQSEFLSEIEQLRAKYIQGLARIAKKLDEQGDTAQEREIRYEIKDSRKKGDAFIQHIFNSVD